MTDAVKERARSVWASADYGPIAAGDVLVSELLARAADVHAGDRVLDVAAGTGNSALAAARRGGVATATDIVPGLLEQAERRAAAEGLALTTQEAPADDLPFEDGSFDVVLSSFGCMYAPDHQRAAAELLRVCRPGGRIGLVSWTPRGLTARLQKILAGAMPGPAGPPGGKPPVMWGDATYCAGLFGDRVAQASFEVLTDEWCAPSAAAQVGVLERHLPPWSAATRRLPEEARAKVAEAAAAEIQKANRASDGTVVAAAEYLQCVLVRR